MSCFYAAVLERFENRWLWNLQLMNNWTWHFIWSSAVQWISFGYPNVCRLWACRRRFSKLHTCSSREVTHFGIFWSIRSEFLRLSLDLDVIYLLVLSALFVDNCWRWMEAQDWPCLVFFACPPDFCWALQFQ